MEIFFTILIMTLVFRPAAELEEAYIKNIANRERNIIVSHPTSA